MLQSLNTLPARELRLSFVGWGTYMGLLVAYCLAHQAYIALVPVDIVDSLAWTLREWGLWLLLTPIIGTALHHRKRLASSPRWFYPLLSLAVLALSLGYRVGLDMWQTGGQAINSLVYFFPQYALALAIVIAVWHFLQYNSPATPSRPQQALNQPPQEHRLLVSKGAHETLINLEDIIAISADGNYVDIYTADDTYLLRSTLKQLSERLPAAQFVRTHRSHTVRVSEIDRIENLPAGNGRIYLRSGLCVALSKGYRQSLKS